MHYIAAKGILSARHGMNLYRGCQHGCIYCDARSKCYQMDHPFEDIAVKENALALLEAALRSRRSVCMIGTGAITDPYMPLEERLRLTRGALELIYRYGFGIALQTKSDRVLQDLELLQRINRQTKAVVQITLTTYDDSLCRILEPGVCPTSVRFQTLLALRDAGIPTVVWICPLVPFLNDTRENLLGLLDMCREAQVKGIINFGMGLTLREGSREYFYAQLDKHFSGLKQRYIRTYANAYELPSPNSRELEDLFHSYCKSHGIWHNNDQIFRYLRSFPEQDGSSQLSFL